MGQDQDPKDTEGHKQDPTRTSSGDATTTPRATSTTRTPRADDDSDVEGHKHNPRCLNPRLTRI